MSARAKCPTCDKTLYVRADEKLPHHWGYRRDLLAGEPRCDGSELSTRKWPASIYGVRTQRTPPT